MRAARQALTFWILTLPVWAACTGDPSGLDPFALEDGSVEAIVTDPDLTGLAADEAFVWDGEIPEEARALVQAAREKFTEARAALRQGDREHAFALAEEGRLLLAEALLLVRGDAAYAEGLQRLDAVIAWLEERVEGDLVPPMLQRMTELRAEAVAAWEAGDAIRAVERLLFARHLGDHVRLRFHRDVPAAARYSVALGASAVELAVEAIGPEPTEVQRALLHRAVELERRAHRALQAGAYRIAFHLGRHVVEVTWVAVLDAERPDAADVEAFADLATRVIAAAEAALGDAPTDAQARILGQAKAWQARGMELAETAPLRSAALLWRAAVTANLLV